MEAKKILIIQGGGRSNGNTAQLIDSFTKGAEQAVFYYQFALVNYIGFHDKGMILAGGCGDTNGQPQISKTQHLERAYQFGRTIYNS